MPRDLQAAWPLRSPLGLASCRSLTLCLPKAPLTTCKCWEAAVAYSLWLEWVYLTLSPHLGRLEDGAVALSPCLWPRMCSVLLPQEEWLDGHGGGGEGSCPQTCDEFRMSSECRCGARVEGCGEGQCMCESKRHDR